MSREYIANTLKRLREATDLTADEVGEMIGKSGKTVNAWENGRGQPDAEILIKLCNIYKVDNLLAEFDDEDILEKQNTFSDVEQKMIKKYRDLDEHGKKMVDFVLNEEYDRRTEQKNEEITHTNIFRAAKSTDNHPPEITTTDKDFSKIPPTDIKL